MHPLLQDPEWCEDHAHMSQTEIVALLAPVSHAHVSQMLAKYNRKLTVKTEIEYQAGRDLYHLWGGKLLSKATRRPVMGWYNMARRERWVAPKQWLRYRIQDVWFWREWRWYVQEHFTDFVGIADRIVVSPGEYMEDCDGKCEYWGRCDASTILPCEDITLQNVIDYGPNAQRKTVPERNSKPP